MGNNMRVLIIGVAFCVLLLGCKELDEVDVNGDASSPVFSVSDSGEKLQSLEVLRYCLENEKITFEQKWLVSRQDPGVEVREVKYGVVPSGFTENSAPLPLQAREVYRVEIAALKKDYSGLFVIEERDGKREIKVVGALNGISFEDWLKTNRNLLKVTCE